MTAPNFASGTIWTADNLNIMRGMNSASVDLIYLDPPFNSNRNYEAPIGSKAAGAAFKDAWTLDDIDVHEHGELADRNPAAYSVIEAARQAHGKPMQSYLIFMAVRLLEMQRLLKPSGSVYLHCDPTASHYLKLLMDGVFGRVIFRNEIVWRYKKYQKAEMRYFTRNSDRVLFYVGSPESDKGFTPLYDPLKKPKRFLKRVWDKESKRIVNAKNSEGRVQYMTVDKEKIDDVWAISYLMPASRERLGYPTQKPLTLLSRIIEASSAPGDLVLDPFCGCATTLVAADRLGRQWAGIDLSPLAVKLVDERIAEDRKDKKGGEVIGGGLFRATALMEPPKRTDLGKLPNYRTHRHRLYGEQEGVCVGCDTHFPFRVMDADHILPRSRGGTDHPDNLQLLCSGCNRSKGGKTMAEWRAAQ